MRVSERSNANFVKHKPDGNKQKNNDMTKLLSIHGENTTLLKLVKIPHHGGYIELSFLFPTSKSQLFPNNIASGSSGWRIGCKVLRYLNSIKFLGSFQKHLRDQDITNFQYTL